MKLYPILLSLFTTSAVYVQCDTQTGSNLAQDSVQNTQKIGQQSSFWQGDEALPSCIPCGCGYPAGINLQCSYDVSITASYLYWFAGEDGLDLGTSIVFDSLTNTGVAPSTGGKVFRPDFGYASGFKVGLGWVCWDNWKFKADYTRYHHNTRFNQQAPTQTGGIGAIYLTNWFYQTSAQSQGVIARNLSSKWSLGIDWLDVVLERPYYLGRRLTLNPFYGLRLSWIDQKVNLSVTNVLNFSPPTPSVDSNNRLNSWGIGPKAGVEGRYLLGSDFRLEGSAGGSLLYTRYTTISHSEGSLSAGGAGIAYSDNGRNALRPYIEASLGLGWGTYFFCQRYHFDLSATYDFNYLWAQNMVRVLNDLNVSGTGAAASDLFLHGLTVTAAFDF